MKIKTFITYLVILSLAGTQLLSSASFLAAQENPSETSPRMLSLSTPENPVLLKGIKIFPEEPFKYSFIVDSGEKNLSDQDFERETTKMIKYFLASLTIPPEDLWVNLSPHEKDRIIPGSFGQTEMGRDLLLQDYVLKQLTASLMYPEKDLGEKFWEEVYAQIYKEYGRTDIPLDTFNKVWIVPDKAVVFEQKDAAFIINSHLKVVTEEDYFAMMKGRQLDAIHANGLSKEQQNNVNLPSSIIKRIIIPAIEKEVNTGQHFISLRQMYQAMILAEWFRRHLEASLLGTVYVGKKKIRGIDIEDNKMKEKVYEQYLDIFKQGVFNYIKEDYDPRTQQVMPRKYFSGGVNIPIQLRTMYEGSTDQAMLNEISEKVKTRLKQIYVNLIKEMFGRTAEQRKTMEIMQADATLKPLLNNLLLSEGPETRPDNQLISGYYGNIFRHSAYPQRFIKIIRDEKEGLTRQDLNRINMHEAVRLLALKDLALEGHIPRLVAWGIKKDGRFWMDIEGITNSISLRMVKQAKQYSHIEEDLNLSEQVGIFIRAAESLKALHEKGWVHDDMRLSHIIVNVFNLDQVMPIDFTFAAKAGTEVNRAERSPLLSAPEPFAIPRSDVYGLGLALWEYFINQFPQATGERQNMWDIFNNRLDVELIPLPVMDSELIELISDMIHQEFDQRPDMDTVIKKLGVIKATFALQEARQAAEAPREQPEEGVDNAMLSGVKAQTIISWLAKRGKSIIEFMRTPSLWDDWEKESEAFLEQFKGQPQWAGIDQNRQQREELARLRTFDQMDMGYLDLDNLEMNRLTPLQGSVGADGMILTQEDFVQTGVFFKVPPTYNVDMNIDLMMEAENYSILSSLSAEGVIPRLLAIGVNPDGRFWMKLQGLSSNATSINRSEAFQSLPLREKLSLFISSARQLQRIHETGRVHNDVAPRNILYDGQKLMWIDLSRMRPKGASFKVTLQEMMHRYAPSETRRVEKSDVYSFGKSLADFTRLHDRNILRQMGLPQLIRQMSGQKAFHMVDSRPTMTEVIERLEAMRQMIITQDLNDQATERAFDQAMLTAPMAVQLIQNRLPGDVSEADRLFVEQLEQDGIFQQLLESGLMVSQAVDYEGFEPSPVEEAFAVMLESVDVVGEGILRAKQPGDNVLVLKEILRLGQLNDFSRRGVVPTIRRFGIDQDGLMYVRMQTLPESQTVLSEAWQGLAVTDKLEVLRQAAVQMQAIHQKGLVHRDLQPNRITFDQTASFVQLNGFAQSGLEGESRLAVPSLYTAPDQDVTGMSDVYSLGMILWESLLGGFIDESSINVADKLSIFLSLDRSQFDQDIVNSGIFDLIAQMISPTTIGRPAMQDVSQRLNAVREYLVRAQTQVTDYDGADKVVLDTFETPAATAEEPVGGIDLNPTLLDMDTIQKEGVPLPPVKFNPTEFKDLEGLTPVIMQIMPVTNLPLLLGVNIDQETLEGIPLASTR